MDVALLDSLQAGAVALSAPLFLIVAAVVVLMSDIAGRRSALRSWTPFFAYFGVLGAGAIAWRQAAELATTEVTRLGTSATNLFWGGGVAFDSFGIGINLVLSVAALLTLLMSGRYLEERGLPRGEFFALILFATAGAMIMGQSADLINLFVGLEVLSVALYILIGFARKDRKSEESAVKYFLLGAFASGFLLYGIALVYGAAGITAATLQITAGHSLTSFSSLSELLQKSAGTAHPLIAQPLFVVGVAFLLVGLGFKAALAPFHSYAPDVYEGAPSPVAGFMSAAAKLGAFGGLIRLMLPIVSQGDSAALFRTLLWVVALLTMVIGNVMAFRQTNLKRMLAYSSIAHAGYILVGVLAGCTQRGALAAEGVLFYLFAYTLMNLGSFAIPVWLGKGGDEASEISELAGLGRRNPLAAGLLTIFMLSLAGVPPTVGFLGKLYLFLGAWRAGFPGLSVTALLLSGLGLFYYLNVVMKLYFEEGRTGESEPGRPDARRAALLAGIATVLFGLVPLGVLAPRIGAARAIAPVAEAPSTPTAGGSIEAPSH